MKNLNLLISAIVLVALFTAAYYLGPSEQQEPFTLPEQKNEIPKFSSCSEISASFRESRDRGYGIFSILGAVGAPEAGKSDAAQEASYSTTNIQVQGVDEADIVKTDGKYIYTLSNGKLAIAEAYPAENAEVLSVTGLGDFEPQEMFIGNDRVMLFGYTYEKVPYPEPVPRTEKESAEGAAVEASIVPPYYQRSFTSVQLWNVLDKENPIMDRKAEFEGHYLTSRKIGSDVYFVVNSYPDYYILEQAAGEGIVPVYREVSAVDSGEADFEPVAMCGNIGYLEPVVAESFVTIGSISMADATAEIKKETVVGSGQNVYASLNNLYLAAVSYNVFPVPLVREIVPSTETTKIHKFSLQNGEISYTASGEAPGHILNQFSMDEFNGNFRIATTEGRVTRTGSSTSNNIYVFGSDLKIVGKLEGLAPGESIYSARFMGEKAYLVTFVKIDPLFVIDLSNPANPKVLGKLKIPGYSDYLHPIDETHLIGIGKEALPADEGDFSWYQGIKMAVFDVSNVEKPIELYKTEIGDRGTDSYALHDHKAFLYDKEKQLLVIPVLLAEIDESKYPQGIEPWQHGDYIYQGAYVYNLTLENGFELKGRVTHVDDPEEFLKTGYYYYGQGNAVKRSLYIDNVLYTISGNKILANNLSDLSLVKELELAE